MPNQNVGLLEECPPAIQTGILSDEAIFGGSVERSQLQSKRQELPKAPEWIPVSDPTSDEHLFIVTTQPKWLLKAKYDLKRVAVLPENWDSYGSPSISDELLANAEDFLNILDVKLIPPPFVAPISGGGIQLEWCLGERELEIEFVKPNVLGYLKIVNDKIVEQGEFPPHNYNRAYQLITWLRSGSQVTV